MKREFGWYREKGKCIHHVAKCKNCGAGVQATDRQRHKETPEFSWLWHLNAIIPCCKKPSYYFGDAI